MNTSVWIYPWDIADHGVDAVAEAIGGLDAVNVAASYHSLFAAVPDNPKRHMIDIPDSALYLRPDPARWSSCPVRPEVSPLVDRHGDALDLAAAIARRAGCAVTAWLVCLHATRLARSRPDLTVENLWGEPLSWALCVSNPAVRRYARTLVGDAASRSDRVQLESAHWMPAPHHRHAKLPARHADRLATLLSYCFCGHCRAAAGNQGLDLDGVRGQLRGEWAAAWEGAAGNLPPVPAEYLAFRRRQVTALIAELVEASPVPVEVVAFGDRDVSGVDLRALESVGADVRVLAYGSPDQVETGLAELAGAPDAPARYGVGLSLLADTVTRREEFRANLALARRSGADSVALYHFGLADAARRGWLADLPAPTRDTSHA